MGTRLIQTTALAFLACATLVGCGRSGETGLVSSSLTDESVRPATELLRLGRIEGDGPEMFGKVRFVIADDLGRVFVGDEIAQEVRVFDSEGHFLRTLGRGGEGPGEFRGLSGLAFDPRGRAWVWDQLQQRFSVFDTSGAFVRSVPRRWPSSAVPWPGVFSVDGSLLDIRADMGGLDPQRRVTQTFQHGGRVVRLDTVMTPIDSLPIVSVERTAFAGNIIIPFEGGVVAAVEPDGSMWFTHGPTYRIMRTDAKGDTTLTFLLDAPLVPVTPQERDSALAGMHLPPSLPAMEPDFIPENKPAIVRLVRLGRDWIGAFPQLGSDTGRYMDVFSPDGHHQGRVDFGTKLLLVRGAPYAGRGKLYGVTTDEFDVPFVVAFALGIPALSS